MTSRGQRFEAANPARVLGRAFRLPSRAVSRSHPTSRRATTALGTLSAAALALVGCASNAARGQSTVRAFGTAHSSRASQRANTRILANGPIAEPIAQPQAPTSAQSERNRATLAQSSERPPQSEPEERTVAVAGTDVRAGIAVAEVAAPFALVSAALQDFSTYRQFLPRLNESRVVRRRRAESEVYLRAELLEGFGVVWALERFRVTRATGSILVEGERLDGTMRRFDVRIEAVEIAGTNRTRIAVYLLGLPPFPLPSGYLSRQHGRWTARALRALAARVETLATTQARRP